MNEQEKRRRRQKERRREKQFVRKTMLKSVGAAIILCVLIVVMVPLVPKLLNGRIDRQLQARDYEGAEKTATYLGSEAVAQTRMRVSYLQAEDLMMAGEYERARSGFLALRDFSDAAERADECVYRQARDLTERGEYEEALKRFISVSGFRDAMDGADLCRYRLAEKAALEGELYEALRMFEALGDYADASQRMAAIAVTVTGESDPATALMLVNSFSEEEMMLLERMNDMKALLRSGMIAVGNRHTVALTAEGRALATGDNSVGQLNVEAWDGLVKIAAGAWHTVGLRADGTVVATGKNENGECDVAQWQNVVNIAVGASDTYGLTAEGEILHTGFSTKTAAQGWSGVRDLAAGSYAAAALYGNGTMVSTSAACLLEGYTDLVAVDVNTAYGVGITRMGRAVATFGELDWTGVVVISASGAGVMGIDADGNVLTHFFRAQAPYAITDLPARAVSIAAGGDHSAVVLEDGTVRVYGKNDVGQGEVADWKLF